MKNRIAFILIAAACFMNGCASKPQESPPSQGSGDVEEVQVEKEIELEPENNDEQTEPSEPSEKSKEDRIKDAGDILQIDLRHTYAVEAREDGIALAMSAYPQIDVVEASPDLESVLNAYNSTKKAECEKETSDIAALAKDSELEPGDYYKADTFAQVMRADNSVLSLKEVHSGFQGGAHPDFYYVTHNFDSATGKELTIEDVVNEPEKLPEIIYGLIKEDKDTMDMVIVEDVPKAISELLGLTKSEDEGNPGSIFTIGYDGITFYFSPYALTAYAAGPIVKTLKYEDYPDLLKAEYKSDTSSYIVPLDSYTDIEIDGKTLNWNFEEAEEDSWSGPISVSFGDQEMQAVASGNSGKAYLVKDGNRKYLYVKMSDLGDYYSTYIFDLNDSGKSASRLFPMGFATDAPTNPWNMEFSGRLDAFSTLSYVSHYELGDDGMPALAEKYSEIIEKHELTLKKDIEAEEVDEEGESVGKAELKEGDVITFYRTDCDHIVDFHDSNGKIIRFTYSEDIFPQMVNGINAEEVFDGIVYAS